MRVSGRQGHIVSSAPNSIEGVLPPDDSGSTTFRRYRYQAHVAFPFILACATNSGVTAVLLEHIEDLAVEMHGTWRLMQIKTRDGHRGPWGITEVLSSGGLESLFRSHRAVVGHVENATYELVLEGSIEHSPGITALVNSSELSEDLVERIHNRIKGSFADCTLDEVEDFLSRFRVRALSDTRDTIENRNIRLVVEAAPSLNGAQHKAVFEAVMDLAESAMAAEHANALAQALLQEAANVERKALRQADLAHVAASLRQGPSALLRAIVEEDSDITQLVQKLLMGGAAQGIIDSARRLRAEASIWEMSQMAAGNLHDDELEDLRVRLEVVATTALAIHEDEQSPANAIWNQLLQQLHASPQAFDRRALFDADPMLLLGEICEMSDQCRLGWGVANA